MINASDKTKSILLTISMLCIPQLAMAQPPTLKIQPELSSIEFIGTQNGAPVSGKFTKFSGDIHFDPNNLKESSANILVDINSISMNFQDAVQTLKMPDWFNVSVFPQASFHSKQITKIDDVHYSATGDLTIRDKTLPVSIDLLLVKSTSNELNLKGQTTVKRILFGVGQGDWADTKEIQDDVKINFNFMLKN